MKRLMRRPYSQSQRADKLYYQLHKKVIEVHLEAQRAKALLSLQIEELKGILQ